MIIKNDSQTTIKEERLRTLATLEKKTKEGGRYTENVAKHIEKMRAIINQAQTQNTD